MRIRLWLVAVGAAAIVAAQTDPNAKGAPPASASRPVVTLGSASAKRGDTVPIAVEFAGDLSGVHVTLGGKDASFDVQGKRIVMNVPSDQPLGTADVVITMAAGSFQARDQLNVLAGSSEPGID